MAKYLGIVTLLASLILVNIFETKISNTELIIDDYIESETKKSLGLINHYKELRKRNEEMDSIGDKVIKLYDDIKKNDVYSKILRNEILNNFPKQDNNLSGLDNLSLFNKLCYFLIKESRSLEDEFYSMLIIEQLELAKSDSLNLKLTPIRYIKDNNHIKYYYNDKPINRNHLIDFEGNISELSAIISNPVTNEIHTIEGK